MKIFELENKNDVSVVNTFTFIMFFLEVAFVFTKLLKK